MIRMKCENPLPHAKILGMVMPCRKCKPCQNAMRRDWVNRMKLECFGSPYPLLVTWTYDPRFYPGDEVGCKHDLRKLYNRIRKAGHDLRYFTAIERGTKRKRVHAHSVIWSNSLLAKRPVDCKHELERLWGNGFIDVQPIMSAGALAYVAKYIQKDKSECGVKNYSYSQKPMLGEKGLRQWEKAVHHYHEQGVQFDNGNAIAPGKINLPIFGKLETCWVTSSQYVAFTKAIGVDYLRDTVDIVPKSSNSKVMDKDGKSEPAQYIVEQEYRKAKAKD